MTEPICLSYGSIAVVPSRQMAFSNILGLTAVHAIEYDLRMIDYRQPLEVFWSSHDSRQVFGQGPDVGHRYSNRSFLSVDIPPPTILPPLRLQNSAFLEVKKAKKKKTNISLSIYTKIETDKKKKKKNLSISTADRAIDKNKKKTKMSSSEKVSASHILIKHQGSRRKASWKDPDGRVISATTRDSAVSQLKSLRDDIVNGKAKFDDIASRFSDCSSAKRGGDLGSFGRGQMQKPFEEATYALKIGEISNIVDTDSGVHIIMRTG
ncbi:Peptide methionine sulfoxide reductase MsrA domain [Dillenia turbinata]|uniref:Peptidyl-prolyl cis-trans isomerase n=1 Tax=Dillenia turbinata TaxID=194707 RepID=A0AAN8V3Y3_9MAGN